MIPVAIVSGDFTQTGGMDRANYALADYLARQGGSVHLVSHRVADGLRSYPNVIVHQVRKPLRSYYLGEPLLNWTGTRAARQIASRGGRVIVNGGNCRFGDVNWVHYVHAAYRPVVRGSYLRRAKNCLFHQSSRWAEKQVVSRATLIIANSDTTRRHVVEYLGVADDRVRRVYYGADSGQFKPISQTTRAEVRRDLGWPTSQPLAVFVGGLGDRRKGFDVVFEAWQVLCKAPTWDVDLIVIGTGSELPRWQALAMEAGLDRRMRFLGFRTDVPRLLPACDVLVAPTRYEAYGLGVQEAICCGLPALVSRDAGIAERFPSSLRELLLPKPDDVQDLARRLLEWRSRLESLAADVLPFAKELAGRTWDMMAEEIQGLIDGSRGAKLESINC
jgi:glycosyltransferase involved in cell wall biosynthesis